jgi:transposase
MRIVKEIGSLVLLKAMAERMNIRGLIDALIPMERERGLTHGQVFEACVINRCHAPVPLYEMEEWAEYSGMADLYGCSAQLFNDDRIRSTLDVVHQYASDIQNALALRAMTEFAVPADTVAYDMTSLYFEGDYDDSETITFGYSRDGKPDKKQVNVGLTVSTEGGVPLNGRVLAGKTADPATVEANVSALKKALRRQDFLQITDGGMLTPKNVHVLEQQGIHFLAPWQADTAIFESLTAGGTVIWEELPYWGAKGHDRYWATELGILVTYDEVHEDQTPPERQPGQRGRLPEHPVTQHSYWERAVIIRSSNKQSRDEKTRNRRLAKLEEQLQTLSEGLNKRRLKTNQQVQSKLDRIFSGSYAAYRRCFAIELSGPDGQMTLHWEPNEEALDHLKKGEGLYVLLTNRKDSEADPASRILELYKKRNPVENRFRDFKSHLRVRPLFVHTDDRVASLVLITVVALQLYSLIEWEARKAQEAWTTRFLKKKFASICILQTVHPNDDVEIEWCNVTPEHLRILETLGLRLIELPERLAGFT